MKNFISKYLNQIIIIFTILIIVFLTTRFSNMFGSNTDWINQHTIIPEYFRQTFYQTGKLIPNLALNYGGGQNIFNLSYYGLLSPLILPSYLLPFISMTTYLTGINILIVITSSLLFYTFLKRHNFSNSISLTTTLLFTLSAPLIFQMHRHIMFVNYMPFLIMSLIGVDNLIQKNKKTLLIISIFLMIMTSYYYSVCGILVVGIYYIYAHLKHHQTFILKTFIKDLLKFISLIFLSIMMSAILLLPTMYTLLIGRGESESNYTLLSLLTPYLRIHKIFCGTYAIGLSLIGFIALIYLFYTKKRHNIVIGIISSIILFIPIFRYLLNGGLYLREKCFIPFLPLIAYFIAIFLKDLFNQKFNIKSFTIYLIIICAPLYYFNQAQYCYLILLGFIILLLIYKKYNKSWIINGYLIITALAICIGENLSEDIVNINEYNKIFNSKTTNAINEILTNDNSYYRTNNLDYPTTTVNKIYDNRYLTTNYYSSTYNKDYLDFVRNEFPNSMLDYNYFLISGNKNILFNSFMGVKYLYSSTDLGLGYTKVSDNLYQNELALPLIYGTSKLISTHTYQTYSYPYNLELLLNSTIVDDEINNLEIINNHIKEVSLNYQIISNKGVNITKDDKGYILKVDDTGYLKIKLDNPLNNKLLFINLYGLKENTCSIDNIQMTINNVSNILTCKTWIYSNKNNTFHFLINDKYLDTLEINLKKGTYNITDIKTYILDYNNLSTIKDNKTEMTIENIDNDIITGTINIQEDGYLVTSIPYDEGFKISIDGIDSPITKVNTAFLGTKLEKGYHKIIITYHSPWLLTGKIISLISILIFFIIVINKNHQNKKIRSKNETNKKVISKI